jgi:tetratricopeptide (TPR) repeat protein
MNCLKYSATLLLVGILSIGATSQVFAQDDNYANAISAFNKALEHAKANEFENAINMYNQAISLAEQSDNEKAPEIVDRSQNQLPSIYFQLAASKYKNFQKNQNMANLD